MKRMKALTSAAVLCTLLLMLATEVGHAQAVAQKQSPPTEKRFWVFLTTGKSAKAVERAEIEEMQAAHLANFGRLHADGKLFAAGPMADPDQKKRGIVVVAAPDVKSLPELFKPDPYVTQGFMTLDATEMEIAVGEFRTEIDPTALAEYRLVMLEDAKEDTGEIAAEMQEKNAEYCDSIHDDERLCFAAWLKDDADHRRAVLVFRKLDDDALAKLVDELPAVKSKAWKSSTFPLYMAEGIVK